MTVADLMVREVVTIGPDDLLFDAVMEMHKHHVRHLPVVDSRGYLLGIISNRDIRLLATALPEEDMVQGKYSLSLNSCVGTVMEEHPILTGPDTTLGEIMEMFLEQKVGAIPVVDEDNLVVGIIGYIDLLRYFQENYEL